jgi:hypothetical protein
LILFVILGAVGVGTASALMTITLAGDVTITGDTTLQGDLTCTDCIDFSELTIVPGGLANGDQDGLRTYNKNIPAGGYGIPCNSLNSDVSTVAYLMRDSAAITQLGFDPIFGQIFAEASADPYIGEIILFGGNFAPRGWAFAQGQLLPINQNTALFSILGTMYGGDGRVNFALPDLRCLEPNVTDPNGPHYIIALIGIYPTPP